MNIIRYHYNPKKSLIELPGRVFGPCGDVNITLIFDPGSFRTILSSSILHSIGYDTKSNLGNVQTTSVSGIEKGTLLCVDELKFLTFCFKRIDIACFDLPPRYQIDGLIGLDVLEHFEVSLNHRERWIQFNKLD